MHRFISEGVIIGSDLVTLRFFGAFPDLTCRKAVYLAGAGAGQNDVTTTVLFSEKHLAGLFQFPWNWFHSFLPQLSYYSPRPDSNTYSLMTTLVRSTSGSGALFIMTVIDLSPRKFIHPLDIPRYDTVEASQLNTMLWKSVRRRHHDENRHSLVSAHHSTANKGLEGIPSAETEDAASTSRVATPLHVAFTHSIYQLHIILKSNFDIPSPYFFTSVF